MGAKNGKLMKRNMICISCGPIGTFMVNNKKKYIVTNDDLGYALTIYLVSKTHISDVFEE